jgi:zinc-ribbon domain
MAVSKCVNCGANIPASAAFCPNCGAQKVAQPVPQPMATAPQPVYGGPSSVMGMLDTVFSKIIIFVMILLGLLLACIGGILILFTSGGVVKAGAILNSIGFLFIGTFLLMGGLVNKEFDNYVRLGMVISGALMLTWTLSWAA